MFDDYFDGLDDFLNFDFVGKLGEVILADSDLIIGLLQLQLQRGVDADDQPLNAKYGPFYMPQTIRKRIKAGRQVDVVDYYFSGNLYSSLYVVDEGDGFYITSDITYFEQVEAMGGERAFQLSDANLQALVDSTIVPDLQDNFDKETNLGSPL